MLGIIATIIAVVKRHYTFAAFTGGWVVLALILSVNGLTSYAFGPGPVFLAIAICMRKIPRETEPAETVLSAEITKNEDPEMKFVCMSCGTYCTGWYQTCPVCGAVGRIKSMEEVAAAGEAETGGNRKIYFCRSCGYVGNDIAGKTNSCPKCRETLLETGLTREQWLPLTDAEKEADKENWRNGVLNEASEPEAETKSDCTETAAATPKFCRICGKSLSLSTHFCPFCGTEILMPENADIPAIEESMPSVDKPFSNDALPGDNEPLLETKPFNDEKIFSSANVPPLIRRAFIFIEDSEWEKADRYLENALDQEPENAFAYIGKLLVNLKLNHVSDLYGYGDSVETNCYYKRAVQFADPELKTELQQLVFSKKTEREILI